VSEFRENLDHFLESTAAVRITRDGEIVGVFTHCRSQRSSPPKKRTHSHWNWPGSRKFLGQMAKAGVTQEDLMRDIDELQRQKHARRS